MTGTEIKNNKSFNVVIMRAQALSTAGSTASAAETDESAANPWGEFVSIHPPDGTLKVASFITSAPVRQSRETGADKRENRKMAKKGRHCIALADDAPLRSLLSNFTLAFPVFFVIASNLIHLFTVISIRTHAIRSPERTQNERSERR